MGDPAVILNRSLYEEDIFLWTQEQARLLRERRFDELDLDNLIDEVESVGRSDKREIRNRMTVLVSHLLQWKFQPGRRTPNWRRTIRDQRVEIETIVGESPSLRPYPEEIFVRIYSAARNLASEETGIDFTLFPEAPPFTIEQALDGTFLPEEPDLYDQS